MKKLLLGMFLVITCISSRASTDSVQPFKIDTLTRTVYVSPRKGGDSWPVLQAASDFCNTTLGYKIKLSQGNYYTSRPWMLCFLIGNNYSTVTYDIQGCTYAMNSQPGYTSNIIPQFTDAPAIIMQLNKGTRIQDITLQGLYRFPNTLNQTQVDTLRFDQWTDGICADNRTAPYAGIVIDPFSDPAYFGTVYPKYTRLLSYYAPGMSLGGSTAITVTGCGITNFVLGVLVTGGWQQNGELINFAHNKIQDVKVCYAYSQAQSKANILEDLMVWGSEHTIVDGVNYGFNHGDASTAPFVDKMNVAGWCHQLFNVYTLSFPFSAKRIYAEGLFKIGIVQGRAGTHFDDFQIDFAGEDPGLPSPDFWYAGYATTWTNCMLRQYNTRPTRLVLDNPANTFEGGCMNAPPIIWSGSAGGSNPWLPSFKNVAMFYWSGSASRTLNSDPTYVYDIRQGIQGWDTVHVDRKTFNGYLACPNTVTGIAVNELIGCSKQFEDQYKAITGANYPVGYVTSVVGNKIYLSNIGVGFHDGDIIPALHYTIRPLP